MYSDCSCVAILIRSNDIEVHGTGKAWYCTTRLLTPHTNLLNFAFHRTISRVGISYCLTSSAEPLLDIPPPSSNCCALMRSLASWGMMRERSDLVKKSSYCAGNFTAWHIYLNTNRERQSGQSITGNDKISCYIYYRSPAYISIYNMV